MKKAIRFITILGFVFTVLLIHPDFAIGQKNRFEQRPIRTQMSNSLVVSPTGVAVGMRDKLLLYDVTYYGLDLNISTTTSAFGGNVTMKGLVGGTPIDTIVIALINTVGVATMITDSVFVEGTRRTFIHQNNLIQIPMNPPHPAGSSFTSCVYYHGDDANMGKGLVRASKYGMTFLITNTWSLYPSYLFPCKDMLEGWADSMDIAITTEPANKVVATGALIQITPTGDGRTRWEFESRWGLTPADLTFAVGPYQEYKTSFYLPAVTDSMVIRGFLFPASPNLGKQIAALEKSKEYLTYFTDLFGVIPFWRNEYHFTTCQWSSGAMSALGFSLFSDIRLDTAVVDGGSYLVFYVPHELSHAWFGSTVGALTECDVWLAEGFATYAEQLVMEYFVPESVARRNMQLNRKEAMSLPGGSVYIPPADRYNPSRVLDNRLSYCKGAAIIHTLRFELGSDSLFLRLIKEYLAEFSGKAITGEVFKNFLERKTGKDFDPFFAQWYYGEGYPSFSIHWGKGTGMVKIISAQTPSMPSVTPLFQTSLEFKLKYAGGDTTVRVFQSSLTDTFEISIAKSVDSIEVDPNRWLLCKVNSVTVSVEKEQTSLPIAFALLQNYPNPFNPVTSIEFRVPNATDVKLSVYDLLGREVAVLVNEKKSAGSYSVLWDASRFSNGVYFYKLAGGSFVQTRRMLLLK